MKQSSLLSIASIIMLSLSLLIVYSLAAQEKTFTLAKTEFFEFERIDLVFYEADYRDWLGIYPKGQLPGTRDANNAIIGSLKWGYIEGEGDFSFPDDLDPTSPNKDLTPGEYTIYYCLNDGYDIAYQMDFKILDNKDAPKPPPPKKLEYSKETVPIISIHKPDDSIVSSYLLYWADKDGLLQDYTFFANVDYKKQITEYTISNDLVVPEAASKIYAYSLLFGKKSDDYVEVDFTNDFKLKESNLLYSFNVITDIHIGYDFDHHLNQALIQIMEKSPNSVGLFTVGDNTDNGLKAEYIKLMDIIDKEFSSSKIPMYFSLGNHDMKGNFETQVNLFKEYTKMPGPYFYNVINGHYFIHLANEDPDSWANLVHISDDQFSWLEGLLEEAKEKGALIFIFLHQPIYNTVAGSLPGQNWDGVKDHKKLRTLIDKYPLAFVFTGHTHWKFDSKQTILNGKGEKANYVNCSAISYLWTDDDAHYDGSEGYFIDVYEDYLLLKGWNFEENRYSGCAQYVFYIDKPDETDDLEPTPTTKKEEKLEISKGNKILLYTLLPLFAIIIVVGITILIKKKKNK